MKTPHVTRKVQSWPRKVPVGWFCGEIWRHDVVNEKGPAPLISSLARILLSLGYSTHFAISVPSNLTIILCLSNQQRDSDSDFSRSFYLDHRQTIPHLGFSHTVCKNNNRPSTRTSHHFSGLSRTWLRNSSAPKHCTGHLDTPRVFHADNSGISALSNTVLVISPHLSNLPDVETQHFNTIFSLTLPILSYQHQSKRSSFTRVHHQIGHLNLHHLTHPHYLYLSTAKMSWLEAIQVALMESLIVLAVQAAVYHVDGTWTVNDDICAYEAAVKSFTKSNAFQSVSSLFVRTPEPESPFIINLRQLFEDFSMGGQVVLDTPTPTAITLKATPTAPSIAPSPNPSGFLTWLLGSRFFSASISVLLLLIIVVTLFVAFQWVLRTAKRAAWNDLQAVLVNEIRPINQALASSNTKCNELSGLVNAQQSTIDEQKEVLEFSHNKYDEVLRMVASQTDTTDDQTNIIDEQRKAIEEQKEMFGIQKATVENLLKLLDSSEYMKKQSDAQLEECRKELAAALEKVESLESQAQESATWETVQEEEIATEALQIAEDAAAGTESQQQIGISSTTEAASSRIASPTALPTIPSVVPQIDPAASPSPSPALTQFLTFMAHPTSVTGTPQPYWVTPPAGSQRYINTGELFFDSFNPQWLDHCGKTLRDLGYTSKMAHDAKAGTKWPSDKKRDYGFKQPEHADKIRNSYPPYLAFKAAKEEEEKRKAASIEPAAGVPESSPAPSTSSSAAQASPPTALASAPAVSASSSPLVAARAPSVPSVLNAPRGMVTQSPMDWQTEPFRFPPLSQKATPSAKNLTVPTHNRGDTPKNIRMGPMHGKLAPATVYPPQSSRRTPAPMMGRYEVQQPSSTRVPNPTALPFRPRAPQ